MKFMERQQTTNKASKEQGRETESETERELHLHLHIKQTELKLNSLSKPRCNLKNSLRIWQAKPFCD